VTVAVTVYTPAVAGAVVDPLAEPAARELSPRPPALLIPVAPLPVATTAE